MKASVKIMRSYDYNHFEICLSSDEDMTLQQVDDMRKEAMRLTDKAVYQYQLAKDNIQYSKYNNFLRKDLEKKVKIIKENFPKSEWTEEQKATVKALDDFEYWDYQDDWGSGEQEG
jgi:hypothetical protein